jgi:ribosomal protein S18 acetylase RimI-like enzyme
MMANIKIDSASEQDLEGISALIEELNQETGGENQLDQEMIKYNLQELFKNGDSYFYLARQKNTIVGFVNFSIRKTILHPSASALIDELIVSKNYRGKGIGESLVKKVIRHCQDLGCCELEVSTFKFNASARKFYRKCGFEEEALLLEMDL